MLLAVGVSNETIWLGVYDQNTLVADSNLSADRLRTAEEYAAILQILLQLRHISPAQIHASALTCVVPSLSLTLKTALTRLTGHAPFVIGAGIKTGLNIRLQNVAAIGADFICLCVGAMRCCKPPLVVVNLDAATTFAAIDATGALVGRSIYPGINSCMQVLSSNSALLPDITLQQQVPLLGKDTVEAMQSGILYGTASLVDGMVARYAAALPDCNVILTGSTAPAIQPLCQTAMQYHAHLLLDGLVEIYRKNHKHL